MTKRGFCHNTLVGPRLLAVIKSRLREIYVKERGMGGNENRVEYKFPA